MKRFLELVNEQIPFGDVSEEFEILYQNLSDEYCKKPEIKNEETKDYRCQFCLNKVFTPEGLFYHFKSCHKEEYEKKFGEKNVKHNERVSFGINFGKEANRIHKEQTERNHHKELFEEMLEGFGIPGSYNWKSWKDIYKLSGEKNIGLLCESFDKFSNEEIAEIYNQFYDDLSFYNEQKERTDLIDKIISYFICNNLFSKNVIDTDIANLYKKTYFKYFDILEEPNLNILGKFTTNELKQISYHLNKKERIGFLEEWEK